MVFADEGTVVYSPSPPRADSPALSRLQETVTSAAKSQSKSIITIMTQSDGKGNIPLFLAVQAFPAISIKILRDMQQVAARAHQDHSKAKRKSAKV